MRRSKRRFSGRYPMTVCWEHLSGNLCRTLKLQGNKLHELCWFRWLGIKNYLQGLPWRAIWFCWRSWRKSRKHKRSSWKGRRLVRDLEFNGWGQVQIYLLPFKKSEGEKIEMVVKMRSSLRSSVSAFYGYSVGQIAASVTLFRKETGKQLQRNFLGFNPI